MAVFFEFCAKYKVVDLVQIYKGYDYNMLRSIPIRKIPAVTERIQSERREMILYEIYIELLGKMSRDTYISFSDFVAMTEQDTRPEEEIRKELAEMNKKFEKGEEDGTI